MFCHEKLINIQLFFALFFLSCVIANDTYPASLVQFERFDLLAPKVLLNNVEAARLEELGNDACITDLQVYLQAIDRKETWALKMLDSSSTRPSGILKGNIFELGSYYECINTKSDGVNTKIQGQHCIYEIQEIRDKSLIPYNPSMSICLPRSCSTKELSRLVETTAKTVNSMELMEMSKVKSVCTDESKKFWNTENTIVVYVLGFYLFFLFMCTMCDLKERCSMTNKSDTKETTSSLACFSVLRSSKKILNMNPETGNLAAVNGLRFISSASIILLHEYLFHGLTVTSNVFDLYELLSPWRTSILMISSFSVDTLFTLSGFFLSCSFLKKVKQKDFSIFELYLHRVIRMTGPVIFIMIFAIFILPNVGSGPRWYFLIDFFFTPCRSKWWSVLFYTQNLHDTDNYCLLHLWSNSTDMQMYTISLIVLYLFHKKEKLFLMILSLLIIASMIIGAVIAGMNKYLLTVISRNTSNNLILESLFALYFPSYTRASPFFIGIIFGYVVQNKSWKLNKTFNFVGWTLTITNYIIFIIMALFAADIKREFNWFFDIVGTATARPLWSLTICWIVYSCIQGTAGPVAQFLSWKYFLPWSRLSYCIYLIHLNVIVLRTYTLKNPSFLSETTLIYTYFGDLLITGIMAYAFSIIIEMPWFVLDDLILKKKSKTSNKIQNSHEKEVKSKNSKIN